MGVSELQLTLDRDDKSRQKWQNFKYVQRYDHDTCNLYRAMCNDRIVNLTRTVELRVENSRCSFFMYSFILSTR